MHPGDIVTTDGVVAQMAHVKWEQIKARIAQLEAALDASARRFELLAVVSDDLVNGVRPSVGAAEARAALKS